MVNIAVCGAAGRMGKKIISLILSDHDVKLSGACEAKGHPDIGLDAGKITGGNENGVIISDTLALSLKNADVLIDFSSRDAVISNVQAAAAGKIPVVIGITGLTEDDKNKIRICSKNIPVLVSSNMSVGVNLLLQIAGDIASMLGKEYDIEIIESHHKTKKDSPSGTALAFAEAIKRTLDAGGRDIRFVCGREGMCGEKSGDEIGIHSVRSGDVIGEHTVIYCGAGEKIEIRHTAHTRDTFVRGAVKAAVWLKGKPSGFYTMKDVLFGK
ncbi:MAG: 4-hydroxy-tetrahydrodipicolinate reductase [bacterium]|nr:4-hydroxy-tetrahydrodipicolinate reductase [bacterium]